MGKHRNGASGRYYNDGQGPGYKNPSGEKWAPGQSGNPSGRKGSKPKRPLDALAEQLWEVLDREAATSNGQTMTVLAGLLTTVCQKGLQDPKLAIRALEYVRDLERVRGSAEAEADPEAISQQEDQLLEEALERKLQERERRREAGGVGGGASINDEVADD